MSDFKNIQELEKRLWSAADELRANTGLTSQEYSRPVLGLIFLRYAEYRYELAKARLLNKGADTRKGRSRGNHLKTAIQAEGTMYVPEGALFSNLLKLPEDSDLGKAVNDAMKALEKENEAIKDALPKTYTVFDNPILASLLKNFANIRFDIGSDVFGRIYEYFLTEFARSEGQGGGEFFTPSTLVRLIAEIIEPYHGTVYDPACGSGGMFVQSAAFVEEHNKVPGDELSCFGQEKTADTVRLAKMNLAVHGLQGEIREGNSYYDDIHHCVDSSGSGRFDFVMANPPFNVNNIQKERLVDDKARFPYGMPRTDNGNYIWIQQFYSALNDTGRAGFVMANSASDARASEMEIRKQIIEDGGIDVMIAISSNFFYTVTLPCSLWFMDKGKRALPLSPPSPPPLPDGEEPKEHYRGGYNFSGMVELARNLRKNQTAAEQALWEILRNRQFLNLKFRRQHQIGNYITDFYCHEHQLVIELDGPVHESEKRQKHDKKRDHYLQSQGCTIIRFKNDSIFNDTKNVLSQIASTVNPSPTGKSQNEDKKVRYRDTVLFIDARNIFTQVTRAVRDFSSEQLNFIANIARLYRGEDIDNTYLQNHPEPEGSSPAGRGGGEGFAEYDLNNQFPDQVYRDIPGLCKIATISEIEQHGWSLNPGRYVGVTHVEEDSDEDFAAKLTALQEELEVLNNEAHELEEVIGENVVKILGAC